MSIRKKISIKIPVFEAVEDMGLGEMRNSPLFKRWAVRADERIGSYYAYKKNICVTTVKDCHAELPCDVVAVLAILIGDYGCDCGTTFNQVLTHVHAVGSVVNSSNGFIIQDNAVICQPLSWEIQDNQIVFGQNIDGQTITIQYLGYQLDAEGWPLVNQNHSDAIGAYIMKKYAERSTFKISDTKKNENEISRLNREWHRLCRHARAEDGDPSPTERAEMVALVNDPLSGIGIASWSLTNNYYFNGL